MSSGVEFDEDKFAYKPRPSVNLQPGVPQAQGFSGQPGQGGNPRMVQWLMDKGIVKSSGIGQAILVAVVIINIIITFIVITRIL